MDEEICATVRFSTKRSGKIKYMEVCVCVWYCFEALHTHMDFTARQKGFLFSIFVWVAAGFAQPLGFLFGWFNQHMY